MTTDSASEYSYVTNLADFNVIRVIIIIVIVIKIIVIKIVYNSKNSDYYSKNCNKIEIIVKRVIIVIVIIIVIRVIIKINNTNNNNNSNCNTI